MKFSTPLTVAATATSTLQSDGSISIAIVLTVPGANGQPQQFGQTGHHIAVQDALPLTEAGPTPAEVELGLGLRDIVTARGIRFLVEKHGQPLADLLPETLRPA